jgi:hypothetical protein
MSDGMTWRSNCPDSGADLSLSTNEFDFFGKWQELLASEIGRSFRPLCQAEL